MTAQLQPMQIIRDLYDLRLDKISERVEKNDAALMRRYKVMKAITRMAKPLLRFEGLLGTQTRIAIELMSSQSVTTDVMWAIEPGRIAIKNYLKNLLQAYETGEPDIVWLEWCVSTDIVYAFGAQPMCTEGLVALGLILEADTVQKLIDESERAGSPTEYCSASKAAVGSVLANQLPPPKCIVTSSHPCDSIVSSYQSVEYLSKAPAFRLDTPYWNDERAYDYYGREVGRLIAFLEEQLGRKLDWDKLKAVCEQVNETNQLVMEINDMYTARPCPGSIFTTVIQWVSRVVGLGLPEVTESTRRIHQVTKKNVEAGRGTVKKENIRIIWFDVPVAFYPVVTWLEETFGAVIVTDVVTYLRTPEIDTSSEESMVKGLAASYMNLPMARQFHGMVEYYMEELTRICDTYQGDCFIFAGHTGCKHSAASIRLLSDYMKKIGMPLLVLSTDIFDRRVTHEAAIKAQIEDFFVSNGLA